MGLVPFGRYPYATFLYWKVKGERIPAP
jgi:hypothetical protein